MNRDAHLDGLYRQLGASYYHSLHGEGTAAEVADAVKSVGEAHHEYGRKQLGPYRDLVARLSAGAWRPQQRLHRWQVRDVMTSDVAAVDSAASYRQVARLLAERSVSAVPVLDDDRRVLGIVSEADMLHKQEREHTSPRRRSHLRTRSDRTKAAARTAAELMTSPAVTIQADAHLGSVARLMNDHHIKRLPVVDASGRLIGIVSRSDLLSVFQRPDVDIAADVRTIIESILLQDAAAVSISVSDGVVTLQGLLSWPDLAPTAVRLASNLDGVVDVIDRLGTRSRERPGPPGKPIGEHRTQPGPRTCA
jgi:CBS domain-containing protein